MDKHLDGLVGRFGYFEKDGVCLIREIVGVHVYYAKTGVLSVRLHFKDVNGYICLKNVVLL